MKYREWVCIDFGVRGWGGKALKFGAFFSFVLFVAVGWGRLGVEAHFFIHVYTTTYY